MTRRFITGCAGLVLAALVCSVPAQVRAGDAEGERERYDELQDLIYKESYGEAYKRANAFVKNYPSSRWLDGAEFWLCYSLQRSTRDYARAFDCYRAFLDEHPDSKWADDAREEYVKLAKRLSDAGDPRGKAALETLRTGGDEGDSEFTLSVLYALMESGDSDLAIKSVRDILKHSKDPELRRHAIFMLMDVDAEEVLPLLIDVAKTDPDVETRRHAIYAISDHAEDDQVIAALLDIMKTEKDTEIRRHVLYAIAEVDQPEVTDILVEVALNDPDEEARRAATYALAEVDDPRATQALESIAKTSTLPGIQTAALYALIERDEAPIGLLKELALSKKSGGEPAELRLAAVYALAEVDDPSVVPVLSEIVRTADDEEVRKAAFYSMAEHGGPEAEKALRLAALDTKDPELAKAAVWGLTEMLDDGDFFLEVYRTSPFEEVRKAALYAAMDSGSAASAGALGSLLEAETDPDQRRNIVWALAETDSDDAVPILARVARTDKDREVRRAAVQALGNIGTPAARDALRGLLNQE